MRLSELRNLRKSDPTWVRVGTYLLIGGAFVFLFASGFSNTALLVALAISFVQFFGVLFLRARRKRRGAS
jgi:hypothetical protein